MLKNTSIVLLSNYQLLFDYFTEVINGKKVSDSIHSCIVNMDNNMFKIQLYKQFRILNKNFMPTFLRVERGVLEEFPVFVRCKVGQRRDKNGELFQSVELKIMKGFEEKEGFQKMFLATEQGKKNGETTVFIGKSMNTDPYGKKYPDSTLFNLSFQKTKS